MRKLLFGFALLSLAVLAMPTAASAQVILTRGGVGYGFGSPYGGGLYGRSIYGYGGGYGFGGRSNYGGYGYPGALGPVGYGGYGNPGVFGAPGLGMGGAYTYPGWFGAQSPGAPGVLGGPAVNPFTSGFGSQTGSFPGWGPSGSGDLAPRMRATVAPAIPVPAAWLTPSAEGTGLAAPRPVENTASITVQVPQADAQVWFDGVSLDKTGTMRTYQSQPLEAGSTYRYTIRARWTKDGQTTDQSHVLSGMQAGGNYQVVFPLKSGQ